MSRLTEKVAYLRGLTDGLRLEENSAEGKLFKEIVSILDIMASEFEDHEVRISYLEEYAEALDADLAELEEDYFEDGRCECDHHEDDDDEDNDYVEVVCPHCKEAVYLDDELFEEDDDDIICPNCGELILFEEDTDDDLED